MNGGEKVVEIMGDASGELTHHFHLLCRCNCSSSRLHLVMYNLLLKLLAFGDVLLTAIK